jgi:transglutaminase-like putative cysteine protease
MTLASLWIGAAVFIATPRFGGVNLAWLRGSARAWRSTPVTLQRTVGFDDQVQLGELGSAIGNPQKVLSVRFRRHPERSPYAVSEELYLRGVILNRYQEGRWEYVHHGDGVLVPVLDPDQDDPPTNLIRQEYRLEPLDRPELFCVWPSVYINRDDRIQFDPALQRFQRHAGLQRRPFAYELATDAIVDGRQLDFVPALAPVEVPPLLEWPNRSLPSLAALARQWMEQADLPVADSVGRVRALERALRSSRRFSYRLGELPRDRMLDPIEDFIVNDPRGHCEYFASALALMLRSQGLPARMVVGFKTDEYNFLEERFWVRQSHAHAWVEAFIPPEAIPANVRERHPRFDWTHGGWLRLDPTPSNPSELSMVEYWKQKWRDWQTAARTAWTQHVMQMSGSQQNFLIYRPMLQTLRETMSRWSDPGSWNGATGEFSATPRQLLALAVPWLVGGMLAFAALVWWLRRNRRFGSARRGRGRAARFRRGRSDRAASTVEFYQRWERLFQHWGLDRGECQTPREFACEAGGRLAEAAGQPQLRDAALRVIEAFYDIRFGGMTLDPRRTAEIEDALLRIQHATHHISPASDSQVQDGEARPGTGAS